MPDPIDTAAAPVLETPDTPAAPAVEPATPAEPTLLSEPSKPVTPPAEPTPTALTAQVSVVKPDGSFIDGWTDAVAGGKYKDEECLKLVTDFPEMLNQFVNQRKAIGKDKVTLPGEKSDESEWNSFYESIGRPKTETGYKTPDVPEELKDIFTEDKLLLSRERAFKLGITEKQYNQYMQDEIADTLKLLSDQDEVDLKASREAKLNAEKELRGELGAAYDERMHIANRIITEAIPKEGDRVAFIEQYGNEVPIIRLLSNIGSRMSEHTAMIDELTQKTPNQLDTRIKELRATPGYMQIGSDMPADERQRITDEIQSLTKKLYPEKAAG
jgi:hypothetical protein